MPLFEFQCKCGTKFEQLVHKADDQGPKTCPKCGKTAPKVDSVPGKMVWGKCGRGF